jgi:hypothetical protein
MARVVRGVSELLIQVAVLIAMFVCSVTIVVIGAGALESLAIAAGWLR